MEKSFEKSKSLYEQAKKLSPAGVHSPVRAFRSVGGSPLFFNKGKGSRIWDVDGNEYIDYCMSWGALALGHAYEATTKAIQKQAELGTHYGTPTPLDVELAGNILAALAPFDSLRFVNSGTEAVMTALRLARGITKREKIIKIDGAYHGHVDSLLVAAGSGLVTSGVSDSAGVTSGQAKDTLVVLPGNKEALKKAFEENPNQIAAIILEPVMANNGLFELGHDYLAFCREITQKHGALLIFDEVITGFRVAWGGAKARYDVLPDIGTYGKIIGGGMPVGAIASTKSMMEHLAPLGKVYQAGTLSGNPIAMAAGIANIQGLKDTKFYEVTESLGQYLEQQVAAVDKINPKIKVRVRRVASLFWFSFGSEKMPAWPQEIPADAKEKYAEFFHKALASGIYMAPSAYEVGFLSSAHTKRDVDAIIEVLKGL